MKKNETDAQGPADKLTCGIIMPISAAESYSMQHWADVKIILEETIAEAGFIPNMVSDANEVGIIHNRIVGNIYNNPIIVCDVSSKNPNVMFELGLRLAFDRATIIIKDDQTSYNFDTAPIEHLTYPRDLRYGAINAFKKKLADKIKATYTASLATGYSAFLKNFVQYKPVLDVKEVSSQEFILKTLQALNQQVLEIRNSMYHSTRPSTGPTPASMENRRIVASALSNYIKLKALEPGQIFKDNALFKEFADYARNEHLIDVTHPDLYDYIGGLMRKVHANMPTENTAANNSG